jgi:hypothetical protein
MLDSKSTPKGIFPPRLSLSSTYSTSPVSTPISGLMVYNTSTTIDVVPIYYYRVGSVSTGNNIPANRNPTRIHGEQENEICPGKATPIELK